MSKDSIFAGNVKKRNEWGEWTFKEPVLDDVLNFRDCFKGSVEELRGDEERSIGLDDIDFGKAKEILEDMIVDWPSDKEINQENLSSIKTEVLMWAFQHVAELVNKSQELSEDEEKNSEGP